MWHKNIDSTEVSTGWGTVSKYPVSTLFLLSFMLIQLTLTGRSKLWAGFFQVGACHDKSAWLV